MYLRDNTKQTSLSYVFTCLHRRCNHGNKSDKDGAEDIDDREDEIDLKTTNHMTNQSNNLTNQNSP